MHPSDFDGLDENKYDVINEVMRRHEELASGKVAGRTHEEVMESARQAVQDSRVNAACPQGF